MDIKEINLNKIPSFSKVKHKLNMVKNALGDYWQVPIMIIKGKPGPVLGVTAAVHGNELNGISIIHKLWHKISPTELTGTVIFAPILNIPGFLSGEREFSDGKDLNRIMPGKPNGTESEVYSYNIVEKILKKFDYHIDLHTASFGRINSFYVRADLQDELIYKMAELQDPQIIVSIRGEEGTLREEARKLGIPAITVEVGDPNIIQSKHMRPSIFGLNNILIELGMINEVKSDYQNEAVICKNSSWLYAKNGGILEVYPALTDMVKKGELIAKIVNLYGDLIEEVKSPVDAVVVAKATNPVCQVGSRIIHLGVLN